MPNEMDNDDSFLLIAGIDNAISPDAKLEQSSQPTNQGLRS